MPWSSQQGRHQKRTGTAGHESARKNERRQGRFPLTTLRKTGTLIKCVFAFSWLRRNSPDGSDNRLSQRNPGKRISRVHLFSAEIVRRNPLPCAAGKVPGFALRVAWVYPSGRPHLLLRAAVLRKFPRKRLKTLRRKAEYLLICVTFA